VPRLGRYSRTALAATAFAGFASAFVTTPVAVHGAGNPAFATPPHVRPLPTRSALSVVLPRRDPFTGDTTRHTQSATSAEMPHVSGAYPPVPGSTAATAVLDTIIPSALRPLPPNAGALNAAPPFATMPNATPPFASVLRAAPPFGSMQAPAVSAPQAFGTPMMRVTAVVTGAHPFALVDEAGTTRLVTVGDRLAGEAIAAITAGGVRLAHGSVLPVAPDSSPVRAGSGGH
jgi:hypothetical protein